MKACDRTDLVHLYADGRLSRPERRAVEEHLASCTSCQRLLVRLRILEERLVSLSPGRPSRDLAPQILERLQQQGARRRLWRPWALGSGALVLGLLGVFLILLAAGFWGPTPLGTTSSLSGVELASSEVEIGVGEMVSYSSETADALLMMGLTAGPAFFLGGVLLFAALGLVLTRLLLWSTESPPLTPTFAPGAPSLR